MNKGAHFKQPTLKKKTLRQQKNGEKMFFSHFGQTKQFRLITV